MPKLLDGPFKRIQVSLFYSDYEYMLDTGRPMSAYIRELVNCNLNLERECREEEKEELILS
jgi:hypothetical protein